MKRVSSDAAGGRQAGAEDENTQVAEAERGPSGREAADGARESLGMGGREGRWLPLGMSQLPDHLSPGPNSRKGLRERVLN